MTLADRIVVLNKGSIEQIGDPETLYNEPANRFLASFIGTPVMNFLEGEHNNLQFTLPEGTQLKDIPANAKSIGIRPNQVVIDPQHFDARVKVQVVEPLGHARLYYGELDGTRFVIESEQRFEVGDLIPVSIHDSVKHCFDQNDDRVQESCEVANAA